MKNLDKLIEQRMQRIMLLVGGTARKIVKKEMRKFKKELMKEVMGDRK